MATLTITWHSTIDNKTCKVCRALNGYTWIFEAGKDEMLDYLLHPTYGRVWSLSEGSHAHGHTNYNCRCFITSEIKAEDILAKCVFLKETILDVLNETEIPDVKKGSYRTTTLEDLGITT